MTISKADILSDITQRCSASRLDRLLRHVVSFYSIKGAHKPIALSAICYIWPVHSLVIDYSPSCALASGGTL